MSQVRINANIPAGDMEVVVPLHLTISDSGKGQLRDALIEGANRILRAYGSEPINHQEPAAEAKKPEPTPEHHPEGNNFSTTERKGPQLEPYELHGQYRPDSYGSISLRWNPGTADRKESPHGG